MPGEKCPDAELTGLGGRGTGEMAWKERKMMLQVQSSGTVGPTGGMAEDTSLAMAPKVTGLTM